jgi:hypothetical protein
MPDFYKRSLVIAMMFAAFMYPAIASAGNVINAMITSVSATNYAGSGTAVPFFIYLSANDANIGCNSANLNAFAIDSTTDGGRAMIAVAMSALLSGQPVSVYGTGNCSVWGLTDTVSSLVLY